MWTDFFQPEDFVAIVPHLELTIFACGILLLDFLLDARYKFVSAITALLGVAFSGFQIWRLHDRTMLAFRGTGDGGLIVVDSFFIYFSFIFLHH